MQTSKRFRLIPAIVLASGLAASAAMAQMQTTLAFETPQVAFEQGLGAFRAGFYEIARPALEHAAQNGEGEQRFQADYFLARLYADNAGSQTNHRRAYEIYRRIAEENADVDPDDPRRAAFVAKSMTALAAYVRNGLPDADVKPDLDRAREYLEFAATVFGHKDAQFELAKLYLSGGKGSSDVRLGMDKLSVLSREGHAGAQAFLADLYWRGKFVAQDRERANGLANLAMENAPASERIWVEDIYQTIHCGSSPDVRKNGQDLVANWRGAFAAGSGDKRMALGGRELTPSRRCANGEVVDVTKFGTGRAEPNLEAPVPMIVPQGRSEGSPAAPALRDVNVRGRDR